MISFDNDYSETACKEVLEAIKSMDNEQNIGYGLDKHSENAAKLIRKVCGNYDLDIHFITGGTPCNVLAMQLLKPYEAIISVKSGHINVHETGAIEHTGHKILIADDKEGKIIPSSIEDICKTHTDEHMVKPKLVFIANATECGTTYIKKELKEIRKVCDKYNLYLYIDGARISNAVVSTDVTLKTIADVSDVFYIGGTKNGALFGEAFAIKNDDLKKDFRYIIKQNCSMLAKGFITGAQFEALFKNNTYLNNARHANEMAGKIRKALKDNKFKFLYETTTNQIFPIISIKQYKTLSKKFIFQKWSNYDKNNIVVRFVTSWNTKQENVDKLIETIKTI